MTDLLIRFLVGGTVVSFFACLGDVLRPKSFAGIFGAAPSIALATLGLSIHHYGHAYTALEARFMVCGAIAFFVYAAAASWILRLGRAGALATAAGLIPLWLGLSLGLWMIAGGRV